MPIDYGTNDVITSGNFSASSADIGDLKISNLDPENLLSVNSISDTDVIITVIDPTGSPITKVIQSSDLRSSLLNQPAELQFRQGTDNERLSIIPASGEPIWTTDTQKFYIGDGSTTGGDFVGPSPYDRGTGTQSIVALNTGCVASNNFSTVGGGNGNTASGLYSTVGGGQNNTASQHSSTVGGGIFNTASSIYSTVSGGTWNSASNGTGCTVGGGGYNGATGIFSTVGGGGGSMFTGNIASGSYSTVSGGIQNTASSSHSTVSGGNQNTASSSSSTVSGGFQNTASGYGSTVSGGLQNNASSFYSTVSGGSINNASGSTSTVGGGQFNNASNNRSTVGGGQNNTASGQYATVVGGKDGVASLWGEEARSSGKFNTNGDAQIRNFILRNKTSNNHIVNLFLSGSSQEIVVPENSTWVYTIKIVGRSASDTESAGYKIEGVMESSSLGTLLLSESKTVLAEDNANWDVDVSIDETGASPIFRITTTVESDQNDVYWVAYVEVVQVIATASTPSY